MKKNTKYKIITIIFSCSLLVTNFVFAVSSDLEVKNSSIKSGDTFETSFFISSSDTDINTAEGKIIFSTSTLKLKEIQDGNSIISFWVERPRIENGEVLFSGIIPGGYMSDKGYMFSLVFEALAPGMGDVLVSDLKILANDGEGSLVKADTAKASFKILKRVDEPQITLEKIQDSIPPEVFTPKVVRDPNLFGGKYFLVFATQDKGSGVDHYEVCEKKLDTCVVAESPYLLKNQALDTEILVKAVDRNANEITITISASKMSIWFKSGIIVIILGILLGGCLIIKKIWRKYKI